VGIGLLTALSGATEVNMVITGDYAVVGLGKINMEIILTLIGKHNSCIIIVLLLYFYFLYFLLL
jgi:hypothetical protein